jgi:outer membrane PBP1 activator LpoA protein
MQRFSFGFIFLAALYVSVSANATQDQPFTTVIHAPESVHAASAVEPSTAVQEQTAPVGDNVAPHIALLLPLKSKSPALARAAEIVQQGFAAASSVQRGIPIRIYSSADESKDVISLYRQAIANGALALAGPLTHDGVSTLAGYSGISIPTLALNTTEKTNYSYNLYFFGLPVENEAREIAQLAHNSKLRNATIVSTGSPLSKRLAAAFAEEWINLGGTITAEVLFRDDYKALINLPVAPWPEGTEPKPASAVSDDNDASQPGRALPPPIAPGNVAFIAAEHEKARLIRPYLNPTLPVYATSLIFKGNANTLANYDLNEIHFVDMPWLLQPDHPAVMIYPHSTSLLEPEVDRLYALGIDSYRLVYALIANRPNNAMPLDGVTGRIHLNGQQFQREPIPAFFRQGLGLTSETLAALNAAKAAAKAALKQAENASSVPPASSTK